LEKDAERNESPPPIVGDARSAISASSSLSSTPEPSMASYSKSIFASQVSSQLQNGPLIPPAPQQFSVRNHASHPSPNPFLQPEMPMSEVDEAQGFGTRTDVAPQPMHLENLGNPLGMSGAGLRLLQNLGPHSQQGQRMYGYGTTASPAPMNAGMMPPQHQHHIHLRQQQLQQIPSGFGLSGQISQRMPLPSISNANSMAGPSSFDYMGNPNYHTSAGSAPYNPYNNGDGTAPTNSITPSPLNDLMGHTLPAAGPPPVSSSPMRSSSFTNGGVMWNSHSERQHQAVPPSYGNNSFGSSPPQPLPQPQLYPHQHDSKPLLPSSLGFNTGGMLHSQQHEQQMPFASSTLPENNMPTQSPFALPSTPASVLNLPKTDDSSMLENLLRPVAAPNEDTTSMLSAYLNQFSLSNDAGRANSTGLWGTSFTNDEGVVPASSLGGLNLSQDQQPEVHSRWHG
jgi:hypothetical protein